MEYSHKCLRAKKSTSLSKKQVEKRNEVKNTSMEEEILYGLQTKDHSLQPSTLGINCKSKDYVKIKVFSESNVPSVLTERHHQCPDQQSEQWLMQNVVLV